MGLPGGHAEREPKVNMQEIRAVARQREIKPGRANKVDLVHKIQRAEGNFDCFGSANLGICDQTGCLWREDCFRVAAKGMKASA